LVASPEHDRWTNAEDDRGKEPAEPESNVLFSVNHSELTDQGANVDEEIKVHVDTLAGDSGVMDNPFALLVRADDKLGERKLLHNKGRDVWLETTSTETENNDANNEGSEGAIGVCDDRWKRSDDENNVGED